MAEVSVSDRQMVDVTQEYERMKAEMMLIRVTLGLAPYHSVVDCVRLLHDEGRTEFERVRGPASGLATYWSPRK